MHGPINIRTDFLFSRRKRSICHVRLKGERADLLKTHSENYIRESFGSLRLFVAVCDVREKLF